LPTEVETGLNFADGTRTFQSNQQDCRVNPRESRMSIAETNKPGVAAVLSLIIPGVGQFYNGTFWRGIFWLIITPGLWIGSGGLLGWICHVISAVTAYNHAKRSLNDADNDEKLYSANAELMKREENFNILKSGKD